MHSSNELIVHTGTHPLRMLQAPPVSKQLTLKDLWSIFSRRKATLLGVLTACTCAGLLLILLTTRRYEGMSEIQVQKDGTDGLGLENMMGGAETPSDALDASITIQTEAQILQSEGLALRVVRDLDLERNSDFKPQFQLNPMDWVVSLLSPAGRPDPKTASLEDSPARRTTVLKIFEKHLKVEPVQGTRLIDVSYFNPDPNVAAAVVNHLIDGLSDYNFQIRSTAASKTANWLGGQLADLRKQSEDLQATVIGLQRASGVFTLGETDAQGREQVYTPVLDSLQQATAQLMQAQSNRIMKGALYHVVETGDPELISGFAGAGMLGTSSTSANTALTLLQNLRGQEATLQAQVNTMEEKFGPAYPKLPETRAALEAVQRSIHQEVTRLGERVKNDYKMSEQIEDSARHVFMNQKTEADALNNKAIEYTIAKQEADQSRNLYESLLQKLKEAGVLAGFRSNNISVVDIARAPYLPSKPNVLLYLAASFAGGIFLGSCAALFLDVMDDKIHNIPELEAHLGEPPLGVVPRYKKSSGWPLYGKRNALVPADGSSLGQFIALYDSRSQYTESLRAMRSSLMLSRVGPAPQVILVTSCASGEGKSTLSSNLAAILAQQKHRSKVLLVEADLRRPSLQRRFSLSRESGLSDLLAEDSSEAAETNAPIRLAGTNGLDFMPAGPVPPYPAELLGSERMREVLRGWRQAYDFIVIDGTPLLPVTDSFILSTMVDLSLIVARYNVTDRHVLERCCRMLQMQNGRNKVGVVVNAVDKSSQYYRQNFDSGFHAYYRTTQNA